jgi:hypothetical protein
MQNEQFQSLVDAQSKSEWEKQWKSLIDETHASAEPFEFNDTVPPTPTESDCFDDFPKNINLDFNFMMNYPVERSYSMPMTPLSPLSPGFSRSATYPPFDQICNSNNNLIMENPASPKKIGGKAPLPYNAFGKIFIDGKRYFECTWKNCNKRFTRLATNANVHWNRHGQVKAYVCEVCSMGFERMCDMRRHVNSSHD